MKTNDKTMGKSRGCEGAQNRGADGNRDNRDDRDAHRSKLGGRRKHGGAGGRSVAAHIIGRPARGPTMTIIRPTYAWAYSLTPRTTTKRLILHHAATKSATPEQIHSWHLANGWSGIGYHYYVRKDGAVYVGRPENVKGAHCENCNSDSIGICFEGNFEAETMPAAQLEAGRELIADITCRYPGIAIGRHRDYGSTACPGKNFPFDGITKEDEMLTDKEIYEACARHAATLSMPEDCKAEFDEAIKAGITDGTNPTQLMPRWQGVLMAFRAGKVNI